VPLAVGALGTLAVLARRRRELAPAVLALAATLGAAEASAAAAVFPAIDMPKTGRPFFERLAPRVSHAEPLGYFGGAFHSYPILVLRRRVVHLRTEAELDRWLRETPSALLLVDASELRKFSLPALRALHVLDRQPVGGDAILLVSR
jgi:hypothetical protein